jgi:hypothetical protein
MSFYAWRQDLPINADIYADITARMGDAKMPGLVVHVAIEKDDGTLQYIDVWESQETHDAAFEDVVHPAVHPVLQDRGVHVQGEPPRTPLKVIDVRFADGTSLR